MNKKQELYKELVEAITELGYPEALGVLVADSLGTELTMDRMLRYLHRWEPSSPEELVDEMLAIISDRDRWQEKIINESYNRKLNELLWYGFGDDDDDEASDETSDEATTSGIDAIATVDTEVFGETSSN